MKLTRGDAIMQTSPTFRMKLLTVNPHLKIVGQRVLACKVSYFLGSDPANWRMRIKRFAEVRYRTRSYRSWVVVWVQMQVRAGL
jgi:hypothetical protein